MNVVSIRSLEEAVKELYVLIVFFQVRYKLMSKVAIIKELYALRSAAIYRKFGKKYFFELQRWGYFYELKSTNFLFTKIHLDRFLSGPERIMIFPKNRLQFF